MCAAWPHRREKAALRIRNLGRALAIVLLTSGPAAAATFHWDGRTYIPLGLQPQSQAVLRFPERLNGYIVEDPGAVQVLTIDTRTLSFSPRNPDVEVRVILRGESGTLYIARASTRLRFYPLMEVETTSPSGAEPREHPRAGSAAVTPVAMMARLMRGEPPAGFRVTSSVRSILKSDEFQLDSEQVWSSTHVTGIVASLKRTAPPGVRVEVDPDRIEILIPELGQLRMIGANRFVLDDRTPASKAYLVFTKN